MPNTVQPVPTCLQRYFSTLTVAWIFVLGILVSIVVPPFQSPDEFEHITRAYLLGKGNIVLTAPSGQSSGGMVDTGLTQYMEMFSPLPFKSERKLSSKEISEAQEISWTGSEVFRPALGMAYYFPGIYALHMLGLKFGEWLNLSVDTSYKLCRLFLLFSTCLILFYSFQLYRPPAVVLALLVIPMSLFQFASASLDGIATALAIFIISVCLNAQVTKEAFKSGLFYLAIAAWLLLASSRLQLFSMILLPALLGWTVRRYRYGVIVVLAALAVVVWQVVVLKTIVDGRVSLGASSSEILQFYLFDPSKFADVMGNTLGNPQLIKGYFSSFFGILGWLDTPFKGAEYKYLFFITVLVALLSVDYKGLMQQLSARAALLLSSIGAVATIFLAMLVTWTPHPALYIDGVQGRYFLIPALLIAYALSGQAIWLNRPKVEKTIMITVFFFALYCAVITMNVLVERYYISAN
jgi:uncharacterized membrane protein